MNEEDGGERYASGVYHVTASGETTWYEFALAAIDMADAIDGYVKMVRSIEKITTAEYPAKAERPLNSHMSNIKIMRDYHVELPSWESGLALCIEELYSAG
jgi:dTDP-4-dehydrorhamnose reductase